MASQTQTRPLWSMSIEVGLANIGSEAHNSSCKPSDTVKVARAFAGGTWAGAGVGQARARRRARGSNRSQRIMIGSSSGRDERGGKVDGTQYTGAGDGLHGTI